MMTGPEWSNAGLKLTMGVAAMGFTAIYAEELDHVLGVWAILALVLGPFVIMVFVRRGEVSNRIAAIAHGAAALWYALLALGAVWLMAGRGFQRSDLVMGAFIALGLWPCISLLRAALRRS